MIINPIGVEVQQTFRARWWTNKSPMVFIAASNTLNAVAWRGYPAGTIMFHGVDCVKRGRMWEINAEFTGRRSWLIRIEGGHVQLYSSSRFADFVPRSAQLRLVRTEILQ